MCEAPSAPGEPDRHPDSFYHSLVTNLPHYYFGKDREGRFVFANALFCESLGKSPEEVVGKTDNDFYPPHLAEKYRRDDDWVLETGKTLETIEEY
jgi:PAS domain S-box-containing protein